MKIKKDAFSKTCFYFRTWDFTDKVTPGLSLFDEVKITPFSNLYNSFDYVVGNPPYVTLYGRRDKKENEEQRINYLNNYHQFPSSVKNGKLNLVMLFIEHSLDFLKENGKLSFIIRASSFKLINFACILFKTTFFTFYRYSNGVAKLDSNS